MVSRLIAFSLLVLALGAALLPAPQQAAAQDTPPALPAQEYADRARRLREFGYPELARTQLEAGARSFPTEKPIVLEHLRLLTHIRAGADEIGLWIRVFHQLYANDYECALAVANWLEMNEELPVPPDFEDPKQLKNALDRLKIEMDVFRELAKFITEPTDKLPEAAKGRPDMPLAYLARCALAKPRELQVDHFAASYLDKLACSFQGWSLIDRALMPFQVAALELFELCIPLYKRIEPDKDSTAYARQRLTEIYFRIGKYAEAKQQALALPNSITAARVLQHIAQRTDDFDLLVDAMDQQARVWRDPKWQLHLLAAKRVREKKWLMATWMAWLGALDGFLPAPAAAAAIQELIAAQPEFLEAYFADASQRVEVAMQAPPQDAQRILESSLAVLEKCKALGEVFIEWHALRANVLWQLGRHKEAALEYKLVAEKDPTDPNAPRYAVAAEEIAAGLYNGNDFLDYRTVLEETGDFRVKLATLKDICARSPKFKLAQALLAKVALLLKEFETAANAAASAIALGAEGMDVRDNSAWAQMRLGKYAKAAEQFKQIDEARPGYNDAGRWHSLCQWAANGSQDEQRAFAKWLSSQDKDQQPTMRRKLIEEAVQLAPRFPEALLELALLEVQLSNFQAAEGLLDRALENARDKWGRAAIHMARGRLFIAGKRVERAVAEFEASYAADRSDGGALLLAAIALHSGNENATASAAMRKLFTEVPNTPLLRPTPEEVNLLDVLPVKSEGARALAPAYAVGDKAEFRVVIAVTGEGKGQSGQELKIEFTMAIEVLEVPDHGGVWKVKATFSDPPSDEWQALDGQQTVLTISPWFGLCEEPQVTVFQNVVNPAIQALTEGFTVGLGDAPVAPPYVWKNTLTKGPPHFGQGDPEGSCLKSVTGDSFTVLRRAMAGRKVGDRSSRDAGFSRVLEAEVESGGSRRALRKVSFQIAKEELAPERDDVIRSHLQVSITAK
ncbi:MAG: tetratricopeptide repeat protein [Planctomycetes bacterium]|nr:tetratricopeptide repeat protein [Planctomycetota bacterium]